jgi:hypothetical protein
MPVARLDTEIENIVEELEAVAARFLPLHARRRPRFFFAQP